MWFGTSEPDDSKGALPYDTYIIEELRSDSNKGFELIPPFLINGKRVESDYTFTADSETMKVEVAFA